MTRDVLELPANHIHVWTGEPPADGSALAKLAPETVLSNDEQQRWRRFQRTSDQDLFAWAHVSLRRVLSRYVLVDPRDWEFREGPHGRPEITSVLGTDLCFNLSHTEGMMAIIVNRSFDAGVDVEKVGRVANIESVARTSFSDAEQRLVQDAPPSERAAKFVEIWTLKEAYLKAQGLGISVDLKSFSFDPNDPAEVRLSHHGGDSSRHGNAPENWFFEIFTKASNHVVAVASRSASAIVRPTIIERHLG